VPVSAEPVSPHRIRPGRRFAGLTGIWPGLPLLRLSPRCRQAMDPVPGVRSVGAWLALAAILLQIAFAAGHSARHFDHLVGAIDSVGSGLGVETTRGAPASPVPASPAGRDLDHCAVGLGLAATASAILANAEPLPLPPGFLLARLQRPIPNIRQPATRHSLPLARAPPVFEIPA
jgi:hypothetical protein